MNREEAMRKLSLVAIAGAALGYFCCTEKGRSMLRQAGDSMRDGMNQLKERLGSGEGSVTEIVQESLSAPHPETAMSQALEEAIAS